jgi:hypothetical protein
VEASGRGTQCIVLVKPGGRSTWLAPYGLAVTTAALTGGLALAVAVVLDLPLRDPDGLLGPSYVRLPAVVALVLLLDVLPATAARYRSGRPLHRALLDAAAVRWPWPRARVVLLGLASFYLTYVAYRNLKSFLPFARRDVLVDEELQVVDRWLALGREPGPLLHDLLGTGVAASVLSWAYLAFLFFVPFSLAVALVWSGHLGRGAWYVTALCLNWALGTLSYYMLPSRGPVYADPASFAALPDTGTSALQESLLRSRIIVLLDPHATERVHGIAAFASLHVSIVFTAALVAQLVRLPGPVRVALWTFFALTVVATIYFGWHYLTDDLAGVLIGATAVWLGAVATGQRRRREPEAAPVAVAQTPTSAAP